MGPGVSGRQALHHLVELGFRKEAAVEHDSGLAPEVREILERVRFHENEIGSLADGHRPALG